MVVIVTKYTIVSTYSMNLIKPLDVLAQRLRRRKTNGKKVEWKKSEKKFDNEFFCPGAVQTTTADSQEETKPEFGRFIVLNNVQTCLDRCPKFHPKWHPIPYVVH